MSVPPIDPIQPPSGPDVGPGFLPPVVTPRKQLNVLALIGFITTVTFTGFVVGSLIISIIGLIQINKQPNRYQGKWLAIVGIVINGFIALFVLFFAYVLIQTG